MKIVNITTYTVYRAVVQLSDGSHREIDIDQATAEVFAKELYAAEMQEPAEPRRPVPGMVQLTPEAAEEEMQEVEYAELADQDQSEGDESVGPEGSESI